MSWIFSRAIRSPILFLGHKIYQNRACASQLVVQHGSSVSAGRRQAFASCHRRCCVSMTSSHQLPCVNWKKENCCYSMSIDERLTSCFIITINDTIQTSAEQTLLHLCQVFPLLLSFAEKWQLSVCLQQKLAWLSWESDKARRWRCWDHVNRSQPKRLLCC